LARTPKCPRTELGLAMKALLSLKEHNFHPVYRPDIDGLRAVAILSVLIFHAFPSMLTGGFVGVDVFFVISGFLISSIIFKSLIRGDFSFTEFYVHRIRRIFPALILVLAASFTFGWYALWPSEFEQLGKHIAASSGFVQNFVLWNESGYFDTESALKPLMHLWSLAVEEQYYLIYPLLLWIAWRLGVNIIMMVIVLGVMSFGYNVDQVNDDAVKAFFFPQARFWELMAGGGLAYYLLITKQVHMTDQLKQLVFRSHAFGRSTVPEQRKVIAKNLLSGIGLLLIVAAVLVMNKETPFPGWWALTPVAGTVCIILAGPEAWLNRKVLANRWMVFVGLISYPLYLWHWPLLSFAHIVESGLPALPVRIAAVIMSFLLACLTYRFVEKPIRFGKQRLIITNSLWVLMVTLAGVGYGCFKLNGLEFRKIVEHAVILDKQLAGINMKYRENEICTERYPVPERKEYKTNIFCVQNRDDNPTLLLLGNSFANHLYVGLITNSHFKHHTILSFGNCDPAWTDPFEVNMVDFATCSPYHRLQQQKLIDNIVTGSGSVRYAIISGLLRDARNPDYISRIKKRVDFLEKNHVKVIIFIPHISLGYDPRGCFSRPFSEAIRTCELPVQDKNDIVATFRPLMISLKNTNPYVSFYDQNQMYCNDKKCSFVRNSLPLFRDAHLSEFGSMEMSKAFEQWAAVNVPGIINK